MFKLCYELELDKSYDLFYLLYYFLHIKANPFLLQKP